jgi:pimeloyl-ACP methyl ester carboxylesterase
VIRPRTIEVGKLRVEYDLADYTDPWRTDEPETVLLHHGYCRNMDFWRAWVPLLARDYRVLRFSGRGCGGTTVPPPDAPYDTNVLVADAIGVLDALSIRRVIWVGESSGGILGLATALEHPSRVAALVLCDTPFRIATHLADAYNIGEKDYASAIGKHGFEAWCRQTLGYRIDRSKTSPALEEWYVKTMGGAPEHIAISHHLNAVHTDFWPRIGEIDAPVLIMVGAQSQLATPERMEAMRKALPNAKFLAFEGYGHGINLLAPERCVAEMRAFLAQAERVGA